tara:strand:+ start:1009 stop:2085 length:1077 start_codon:yes stop_codon:yes gene_type:complete
MLKRITVLAIVALSFNSQAAIINLNFDDSQFVGTEGQQAKGAFREAADFWESTLKDDVSLNFDINFTQLQSNVIGSASSNRSYIDYGSIGAALYSDAQTPAELASLGGLNCSPNVTTGECEVPFLEDVNGIATVDNDSTADNRIISLTNANAKALGFVVSEPVDATITFNSDFSFDYDRSNGISSNLMDFVGVTIHEIGHALGFTSGVDIVDQNPSLNLDPFSYVSVLDLFRYSDESAGLGLIDMRTGVDSYLSFDGGQTSSSALSTGVNSGDGQQASHFKDNIGAGIMDPTFAFGEFGYVSDNDLAAFNFIGWDLFDLVEEPISVSEPGAPAMLLSGLAMMLLYRRRRDDKIPRQMN